MKEKTAGRESASLAGARRLLTRLAERNACLRLSDGAIVLVDGSADAFSSRPHGVSQDLVLLCVERDWLERDGTDLILSAAGRAWLRRAEAPGDGFRQQHQLRSTQTRDVDGVRRSVLVNDAESPLGWLRRRKDRNGRPLLTEHQYEAGERLRSDYWFAQMSERVTANWSALAPTDRCRRSAPSAGADLRDEVIAAKERVRRALDAVGPELSGVLIDICCELKGLEEAEKAQGWPQRAGKVVLQIALNRLARHYGFDRGEGSRRRRSGEIRHWGSEDYRPTLDQWRKPDPQ